MSEKRWHEDHSKQPDAPWDEWDSYAECWVCNCCGAAACYRFHGPKCEHREDHSPPPTGGDDHGR